jgi:beta-lactamase regulating signal transducer with metallopeptidase domain
MEPLVRWLLTYLVHSTLLLGGAALARLALRERRLALQEAFLRAALVGGFVTAGLQVGLELRPLGGSLAVPEGLAGPARAALAGAPAPARAAGPGGLAAEAPPTRPEPPAPAPMVKAWLARAVVAAGLRGGLALAWAALAAMALARLGVAAFRLRKLLCGRRPIDAGALAPLVAGLGRALGLRGPVRLSAAERLSVPLATGILRPEVCLPARAVAELGADEQAALCAHELAHLARRDPAWLLLARVAEALAPLQPLNAWARRRLQDLAECLSDDLAVAAGGRPIGLARSLVDVASWTLGARSLLPVAAAGALSARSRLGHRVERLMDPDRTLERPRRLLLPAAAAAVLASALVTPVVSGSVIPEEPRPVAAPPAVEAPRPQPQAEPAREIDVTPEVDPVVEVDPALENHRVESAPPPEPPEAPVAPKARPAPAPPAPGAAPLPAPQPVPRPEGPSAATRERLEQLSRQIAERARLHDAEMKALEAEIEALASRIRPDPAEMERLSKEIGKAAQELAESVSADLAGEIGKKSQRTAEAARRMAELEHEIREATRAIRIPQEELRALTEKARALAEQARPTAEEMREIRRLSSEAARLSAEQARDAMRIAEEALRHAREELRRAGEERRD